MVREKIRAPDKPPSLLGMGPYTRALLGVGVIVVAVLGVGYGPAYVTQYQVKTAAKRTCNELGKFIRYGQKEELGKTPEWKRVWMSETRMVGVRLTEEQYDFEFGDDPEDPAKYACEVHVAWESQNHWPLISDFVDIPPVRTVHRLHFFHKVQKNW